MGLFRIGDDNWFLVAFYVLLLGVFLFGILRPRRPSEWRSAGMAQGWVIALYAEMYGLPLTMYLVACLQHRSSNRLLQFRVSRAVRERGVSKTGPGGPTAIPAATDALIAGLHRVRISEFDLEGFLPYSQADA